MFRQTAKVLTVKREVTNFHSPHTQRINKKIFTMFTEISDIYSVQTKNPNHSRVQNGDPSKQDPQK